MDQNQNPSGEGADVDKKSQDSQTGPRARATILDPERVDGLALEIASDSQLPPESSVRDIILATPAIRQTMVAAAVRCLNAQKFYFCKKKGEMVHEPDYATQIKAIAWLAAYSDGLPAQTNLNVNMDARGGKGKKPQLTPAVLEAMERTVARVKREQQALPTTAPVA